MKNTIILFSMVGCVMLAACGGDQPEGTQQLGASVQRLSWLERRWGRNAEGKNRKALWQRSETTTTTDTTAPTTTDTTTTPTTDTTAPTTTDTTTTPTTDTTAPAPTTTEVALAPIAFDDFENGIWGWTDWYQSPGWIYGSDGALAITPPGATHESSWGAGDYAYTHAAVAAYCPPLTNGQCIQYGEGWKNTAYEARVNTVAQTRLVAADGSNQPNAWEVAWLMFRFKDERHYYYMHFKTHHRRDLTQDYGGIEIGKYNCSDQCGLYEQQAGQEVLWAFSANQLASKGITYAEMGRWYDYRVETRDVVLEGGTTGVNIVVKIDGKEVANVTDDGKVVAMGRSAPTPPVSAGGTVALYTEDADVRFDNVRVTPLQ